MPLGFGTSLPFVLPDSILADTIDYDELHAGIRSEGMYTVVETNLQQFTEIAGGVLPLLFLSVAGYVNLGGCKCGCGVACEAAVGMPYARWACDGSVAYTCDGGVGSPLLNFSNAFGAVDEPDAAPCAVQDEGVEWTIMAFFALIPGICAILAAMPARTRAAQRPTARRIATSAGGASISRSRNAAVRVARSAAAGAHVSKASCSRRRSPAPSARSVRQ